MPDIRGREIRRLGLVSFALSRVLGLLWSNSKYQFGLIESVILNCLNLIKKKFKGLLILSQWRS